MRYIQRQPEPAFLVEFKSLNKGHKPALAYRYLDDMKDGRKLRSRLRVHLTESQGYLCAYCCRRIYSQAQGDASSHVEHICPQSVNDGRSLTYENLVASCSDNNSCGMKRKNEYDESLFVSPLEPDCASHFKFYEDGSVRGTDERGEYTCRILGLDSERLRQGRSARIQEVRSVESSGMEPQDYIAFLKEDRGREGQLVEYLDMLEQIF